MKTEKLLCRSAAIIALLLTLFPLGASRGEDKPKAPDFDRWET